LKAIGGALSAIFVSFFSMDVAIVGLFAIDWNFWVILIFCSLVNYLELSIAHIGFNKLEPAMKKLPFFKNLFEKAQDLKNPWIKRCQRSGLIGLFIAGMCTHFVIGASAQIIFRFKNGFYVLIAGNLSKILILCYAMEYGIRKI